MGADINVFFPYRLKSIYWSSKMVFCFWPKQCFYSGKRLWLKKVYTATAWFIIDNQLLSTTVYADKHQFIIHQLS